MVDSRCFRGCKSLFWSYWSGLCFVWLIWTNHIPLEHLKHDVAKMWPGIRFEVIMSWKSETLRHSISNRWTLLRDVRVLRTYFWCFFANHNYVVVGEKTSKICSEHPNIAEKCSPILSVCFTFEAKYAVFPYTGIRVMTGASEHPKRDLQHAIGFQCH